MAFTHQPRPPRPAAKVLFWRQDPRKDPKNKGSPLEKAQAAFSEMSSKACANTAVSECSFGFSPKCRTTAERAVNMLTFHAVESLDRVPTLTNSKLMVSCH